MKRLFALFAALSLAASAQATVLTFDSLTASGNDYNFLGTDYAESGFNLNGGGSGFASANTGNSGWYFGNTSLFNNGGGATTTLTQIGGGSFTLNSIDLAPVSTSWGLGATVTFVGLLDGGGSVTQSFLLDTAYAFQTFAFGGFSNLLSVSWVQSAPYHQFDNIVINETPEPGSLALIGLGLAALAGLRRKQA